MIVDRNGLMRAIKAIEPVIERRNTIPILGNMRIVAAGGKLTMTGTDLDLQVTAQIDHRGDPFDTTVGNIAGLYSLLKAADGAPDAALSSAKGKLGIDVGHVSAELHTLPAEDFPDIPMPAHGWSASAGTEFMSALARVLIAVSTEETRYYLNGIYLHHVADWTYRLVATDGHRLVYADVPLPDAKGAENVLIGAGSLNGYIIPTKMVRNMIRLHRASPKQPVKLMLGSSARQNSQGEPLQGGGSPTRISFEIGGDMPVTLVSKLIDGTFPDYTRVIPAEGTGQHRAKVRTADLRRALGGLVGVASEKTKAVKMHFGEGRIEFAVTSPENGSATIRIDAETAGDAYDIGFNARYLLGMAAATAGEFMYLESASDASPCRITDPDATTMATVLMPMRVG